MNEIKKPEPIPPTMQEAAKIMGLDIKPTLANVKPLQNDLSEPSHTPGPWFNTGPISNHTEPRHCRIFAEHESGGPIKKSIAVAYYGESDTERIANARLIAAAPELLASCIRMLDIIEGRAGLPLAAADEARDAIARARGQEATE